MILNPWSKYWWASCYVGMCLNEGLTEIPLESLWSFIVSELLLSSLWLFKLYYKFAAAKSLQSCPTLCDPIDGGPPGSLVPGILQGRTLEWVAISFSNAWKGKVKVKSLSRVRLLATPWTATYQAPLSMGFSRQEYWSGVPLPSPNMIYKCQKKTINRI